jgi:hypothetical protein
MNQSCPSIEIYSFGIFPSPLCYISVDMRFFWGDENAVQLEVMVVQHCKYAKSQELCTSKCLKY